jgi:DNA-binding beta-propeller fold protein YncE
MRQRAALVLIVPAAVAVAAAVAVGIAFGIGSSNSSAAQAHDQALPGTTACNSTPAPGPLLRPPQPIFTLGSLPGSPYAVAAGPAFAFVSYPDASGGLISVLTLHGATATLIRTVPVSGEAFGLAFSPGDRYLLMANYLGGLDVLSTAALESGSDPVVAQLESAGQGSDEVVVSPDGRYAFVPEEESSDVAVYDLGGLLTGSKSAASTAPPHEIGAIPIGGSPSGIALAPDGKTLYAISQTARNGSLTSMGSLDAISVAAAERDPARAVLAEVNAGCDPVRVAIAPSGAIAWVTDRGGDSLLAFGLTHGGGSPIGALLAAVRVGSEPVSVTFTGSRGLLAITDSARYDDPDADQTIAIVSSTAALAHRPALIGYLPAGAFPRQFGGIPGGPLIFTDYNSDDVRLISASDVRWLQERQPS